MLNSPKTIIDNFYKRLLRLVSSKKLFYAIIALTVIQGLWYAFVFRPNLFDELYHVMASFYYADNPNPFSTVIQDIRWDYLGDMTRSVSYFFYYPLGVLIRIVKLFTNDYIAQVICLRIVMISFFAGGLIMFRKALRLAGFTAAAVNMSLLAMILLPNVAPIPGAVNYDNVIFFLFPAGLYFAIKTIQSTRLNAIWLISLFIIIIIAMLVKLNTAMALFVPIVVYTFYDIWKKHQNKIISSFVSSYKKLNTFLKITLTSVAIIGVGLIIERPLLNLAVYQKASPSCNQILPEQRCVTNIIEKRSVEMKKLKPVGWKPYNPFEYLNIFWVSSMVDTNLRVVWNQPPFPIIQLVFYTFALGGVGLILIGWKDYMKTRVTQMLLVGFILFTASIFYSNYQAYIDLGQPVAMNGRYLIPYMPIFGVLALTTFSTLVNARFKKMLVVFVLPATMILLTQGGGMVTPIIIHDNYWSNDAFSKKLNIKVKNSIRPFVVEKTPFNLF